MLDVEYLYLGGPYDGQWRHPFSGMTPGEVVPERYTREDGEPLGRYVPTKFGHMAGFGEGQFRMSCTVMLDEPWNTLLTEKNSLTGARLGYVKRLERALTHRAFREHLLRTWRTPELIEFGLAWEVMERIPVERPVRDDPQA